MDNIIQGQFGKNNKPMGGPKFPEVRFGESQNSIVCSNCKNTRRVGFWIIVGEHAMLICINCTAQAVLKYQETHIGSQKVFEVDAEISPEAMQKVVAEVVQENRDLPEERVAKIAQSAIEKI
jgi:hypothetical protein